MINKIVMLMCIFISTYTQAEIFEINQIDDIVPYIDQENSLVLFDIDDTLITNPFCLGSPAWRNWLKRTPVKQETDFVFYDAITLYIAKNVDYQTVEPGMETLISDLQRSGIAVFAFTARGRSEWYTTQLEGVDEFTHQQLNHVGIDFKKTAIPAELQDLEPAYFYEGIIFAQHIKKGDLLKHLFKDLNYHPSCIVFIDDKLDQVKSVADAVKEFEIPFYGFWYRRQEQDAGTFNPMVANIQLENLLLNDVIVSDEQAEEIAETMSEIDPQEYFEGIFEQFDINQLDPQGNHAGSRSL